MAFSATFAQNPFRHLSSLPRPTKKNLNFLGRLPSIRAIKAAAEPEKEKLAQAKPEEGSTNAQPASLKIPKKPVYSMKKGQIVRVDKEKYLNSINYLSVGHPPYYKGLDYIYEDRGEVLDLRIFETGEYALVSDPVHQYLRACPNLKSLFPTSDSAIPRFHPYQVGLGIYKIPSCSCFPEARFQSKSGFQVAWVGVPTAPAWLPSDMLIKSEKLNYERL